MIDVFFNHHPIYIAISNSPSCTKSAFLVRFIWLIFFDFLISKIKFLDENRLECSWFSSESVTPKLCGKDNFLCFIRISAGLDHDICFICMISQFLLFYILIYFSVCTSISNIIKKPSIYFVVSCWFLNCLCLFCPQINIPLSLEAAVSTPTFTRRMRRASSWWTLPRPRRRLTRGTAWGLLRYDRSSQSGWYLNVFNLTF